MRKIILEVDVDQVEIKDGEIRYSYEVSDVLFIVNSLTSQKENLIGLKNKLAGKIEQIDKDIMDLENKLLFFKDYREDLLKKLDDGEEKIEPIEEL